MSPDRQAPLLVGVAEPVVAQEQRETERWVWEMRRVAAALADSDGVVQIDHVRLFGPPKLAHVHDNAYGKILCRPWFFRGSEVHSNRAVANRRTIHNWHLTQRGREELL